MNHPLNLHTLLTFEDFELGYKKLKRKKKYKDPRGKDIFPRYISIEEREDNELKKFLDNEAKTKVQRHILFESLKSYAPAPYNAYAISKGTGKGFRPLLVPSPKDRLVFDSLLPKYYSLLQESLRSRHLLGIGLVKKQKISDVLYSVYNDFVSKGYCFALTIDYSAFFSNIDRAILFQKFQKDFGEGILLDILRLAVKNAVNNGEAVQRKTGVMILDNGIPQGLSFSPLLACYYALEIDDLYLSNPAVMGHRYIDDVMLFAKTESDLVQVFKKIEIKSKELKMKPHPLGEINSKTELLDISNKPITFLGVEISVAGGLRISDKKFKEIISVIDKEIFNVRILLNRKESKIKEIYYNYIRGWLNHYEQIHPNPPELHKEIDDLIYNQYFKKDKVRKRYYRKYEWIVISGNKELLRKPKGRL